jgi:hypothetical protein
MLRYLSSDVSPNTSKWETTLSLLNVLILEEEKKKSDSEFLSYSLMLNSGKKIRALCDKRNNYSQNLHQFKNKSVDGR